MLKVGLTGGIACGKSYALREFQKLGVYPIDSDKIAHAVIESGRPAYGQILEAFGSTILGADREIDRKKLGALVFSEEDARKRLNAITHPYILEEENRQLAALQYELSNVRPTIAMVDAALMIETGSFKKYDFVIVVYCHPEIQLRRVMWRDQCSEEEALKRIESQLPTLEKIKFADFVIENSAKLSDTCEQIRQTHAELIARIDEV